jgi:hypothetical protein
MTRLLVLVEDQSEEWFVRDTLAPHLAASGVYAKPTIVLTQRLPQGGGRRGGIGNWGTIRENLRTLLNDTDAWVSTMLDLYGLPADFLGKEDMSGSGNAMAEGLEKQFAAAIGNPRFIPFLTLHEFETLIYSSPRVAAEHFIAPKLEDALQSTVSSVGSPEMIDGGENSHPKARLAHLLKDQGRAYRPVPDGAAILNKIGVPAIRAACGHFDAWVGQLETLGDGRGGRP